MSMRTILEINHDMGVSIERDPAGFVAALVAMIGSASPRTYEPLKRYGVKAVLTVHHTTSRELVIDGKAWRID